MKAKISLFSLALILVLSSAALAGGEKCAREAAMKEKSAKMAAHGWLGLKTDDAHRVTAVAPGSPAAQAVSSRSLSGTHCRTALVTSTSASPGCVHVVTSPRVKLARPPSRGSESTRPLV